MTPCHHRFSRSRMLAALILAGMLLVFNAPAENPLTLTPISGADEGTTIYMVTNDRLTATIPTEPRLPQYDSQARHWMIY